MLSQTLELLQQAGCRLLMRTYARAAPGLPDRTASPGGTARRESLPPALAAWQHAAHVGEAASQRCRTDRCRQLRGRLLVKCVEVGCGGDVGGAGRARGLGAAVAGVKVDRAGDAGRAGTQRARGAQAAAARAAAARAAAVSGCEPVAAERVCSPDPGGPGHECMRGRRPATLRGPARRPSSCTSPTPA